MGQCGCGDSRIDHAYELPSGNVVAYDVYHGCSSCHAGPAVSVSVFDNRNAIWLDGVKIEKLTPTEDGGNDGRGIGIAFFEVSDLIAAAKEIGGTSLEEDEDGYPSVEDWLADNGLRMMQDAMYLFTERIAKQKREVEARMRKAAKAAKRRKP